MIAESKEEIVAEVGDRPWSIGFTGLAESIPAQDRVRLLRLVDDASGGDATYALSRPLFFYTRADSRIVEPFLEYVVGGMGVRLGELLLEPARRVVQQEAIAGGAGACSIVPAALGERIGDVAALCVALEHER